MAIKYGTPQWAGYRRGDTVTVEGPLPDGSLDVNIQDATTDTVIVPAVQQLGANTLAIQAVPDTYTVTVTDSTGMTIGDHFRIINTMGDYYYFGYILGISGNIITLDNPVDYTYMAGSEVTWSNDNMAIDGSVTPVHFHLRTGSPSIPSSIDITRVIMICECSSAVDLNKFGDIIGGLNRGITFRISNGELRNILNIKTNSDLAALAYDWTPYVASNPAQGINGFVWRLTFGSQGKIGVVLRVLGDGQLGWLVQDDLSSLVTLKVMFEGHVTSGE